MTLLAALWDLVSLLLTVFAAIALLILVLVGGALSLAIVDSFLAPRDELLGWNEKPAPKWVDEEIADAEARGRELLREHAGASDA